MMKDLQDVIQPILSEPTPEALVALQGVLLTLKQQGEEVDPALELAGNFYHYLSELRSKIAARDYSELASRLDIGAVGAVALESIISADAHNFWQRLLLGGVAEGLMVAASRQYVKGWEVETGLVHAQAAWYLSEALWHSSSQTQPNLEPDLRWESIQGLLAPAHDAEVLAPDKALLLGRVFQILLLAQLTSLLPSTESDRH